MSLRLMLASGPDPAHRLHRGEDWTQTLTGVTMSVQSTLATTFRPRVTASVNKGTTKLYAHFAQDLINLPPKNGFISPPLQHSETFKEAPSYKRASS